MNNPVCRFLKKKLFFILLFVSSCVFSQNIKPIILLRGDDFGMSHSVNAALQKMAETKIPFNASVMLVGAWAQEATDILKKNAHVAAGIHLTLTSEFKECKWGPVAGKDAVPSLVDERGYFRASVKDFLLSNYALDEIEVEFRAQIERALALGMRIDYVDHHMGIARATPEIAAIVEKLASEYGFVISRYFGETESELWGTAVANKAVELERLVKTMGTGNINMLIFHPGMNDAELGAMHDLNEKIISE